LGERNSALLLAAIWALVMPLLHGFAHLYREQYRVQQLARRRSGA